MAKNVNKLLNSQNLTPFQEKVLLTACRIPPGQVKSYKWIAKEVGSPKSFRAVGQALKNNPFPILIPCHRVIKSDYSLGGFALGQRKKKGLLLKEGLTVARGVVIMNKRKE